jgi:hypothetical protein
LLPAFYAHDLKSEFIYDDNLRLDQIWTREYKLPFIYKNYFYPKTVSKFPEVRALYMRALMYYIQDLNYTAIGYLKRALFREPDNPKILAFLGRNHSIIGNKSATVKFFIQSLKKLPLSAESLSFLANHYYHAKNYYLAVKYYKQHVTNNLVIREELINCSAAAGWVNEKKLKKLCNTKLKNYKNSIIDKELKQIQKKISYPPDYDQLKNKNDIIKNIWKYYNIINILPSNKLQYDGNTAFHNYQKNEYIALRNMLNLIQKLSLLDPLNPIIFKLRNYLYMKYKQEKLREKNYFQYIGLMSDNKIPYFQLASFYVKKNNLIEALVIYRKWMKKKIQLEDPLKMKNGEIFYKISELYRKLGKIDNANLNFQLAEVIENTSDMPSAKRVKERFKKFLAIFKLTPLHIELCQLLYQIALNRKNYTMLDNLQRTIDKLKIKYEIYEK